MNRKEANDKRCIASEIIIQLYEAREMSQLKLLKMQIEVSLDKLEESNEPMN